MSSAVNVWRIKGQAELKRIFIKHLEFVGVVHFHRHVGAEKLSGVMHLEPTGMVGQQRVSGSVRLVEAIARKSLHQVKDFVGLVLREVVCGQRTCAELFAMLGHFFGLFLAHGAAQQVCATERVAAQDLRRLHHLLLVDHDPVGLGEHLGHRGVRVLHFFAAVFAGHKARDQVHRARTVQGVQGNQIFEAARTCVAQHALHAATFKLEHGFGFAIGKQFVRGGIVQRNTVISKVLLALVTRQDEFTRNFQNSECGQTQKVELNQADRLHIVFVVLAHGRGAARLLVQRTKVSQLARRNQYAPCMHADVACQAFELLCQLQEGFNVVLFGQTFGQNRLCLDGSGNGDVLTRLVGYQFADAIAKGVAHVEHAAHITDRCAGGHGAKSHNLTDRIASVFVFNVFDHAVTVGLAKVNVKVGHGDPLRI